MVPGKYVTESLIIALKETEIKAESISVHMHQGKTAIKQLNILRVKHPQ